MRPAKNAHKIVPHVTNAIQDWIERVAKIPADETDEESDVCIIEVSPLQTVTCRSRLSLV